LRLLFQSLRHRNYGAQFKPRDIRRPQRSFKINIRSIKDIGICSKILRDCFFSRDPELFLLLALEAQTGTPFAWETDLRPVPTGEITAF
jgi:hypothetical protein